MTVRIADEHDFEAVMVLLRAMHAESGLAEIDEAKARVYVRQVMNREQGAVMLAIQDGLVVGTMGVLVAQPFWYSAETWLLEAWFFVHPSYREMTRHAADLIEEGESTAKELGLRLLSAVSGRERGLIEDKRRLYRKHFKQVGEIFASEAA